MKKGCLLLLCIIVSLTVASQAKVDSLLQRIDKVDDKQKADIYLKLAKATIKDSAASKSYNRKAYQQAKENKQLPQLGQSLYLSGRILFINRDFTEAIKFYEKSLEVFRQTGDTTEMTTCYNYIGISYFNMSKSKEAIVNYLEALKLTKKDPDYGAEILANIGLVHNELDNTSEAIKYFRQAVAINQSIKDYGSLAVDYDYLGATYSRLKMHDSSLVNYRKALYLFKKTKKEDRYAVSLSNMAWILPNYPDSLNQAIVYFNRAWKKFQEIGWNHYEANILFGIANILSKQGKYDEAITGYIQSIDLANKYKRELFLKRQIYEGLSETYQKKGDYKKALESHILFAQYNDSTFEKQKLEQIANLEKQYETEKKEEEIRQLEGKHQILDIQLQTNRQLKLFGFVTAALLLILLFFMVVRYIDKAKSNHLLELKNIKIAESEHELRLTNAAKNKFFSIIAHDLKNPLHSVMGYSYLLSKDFDRFSDDERRKFATDINQSTNNIFRLLQNLLEWSRSQTGQLVVIPQEIKLSQIVKNATNVLHPLAENKNIKIENQIDQELTVYADPQMIETVIRNLVSNAIKFTPENGLIEISARQTGELIEFCVKDSGIGISEEDAKNLFQIDSKVKRKGTNDEDGSGLGLILCKEFVDRNHGKIWVESTFPKGSSFFFTVPIYSSDPKN
jgi:signal transduction histidine kinase